MEDRPGRYRRRRQRGDDPPRHIPPRGAIHPCRLDQLGIHRLEPRPRQLHEQRHPDDGRRQHARPPRKHQRPREDQQQHVAGHDRRQDERKQDQKPDDAGADSSSVREPPAQQEARPGREQRRHHGDPEAHGDGRPVGRAHRSNPAAVQRSPASASASKSPRPPGSLSKAASNTIWARGTSASTRTRWLATASDP